MSVCTAKSFDLTGKVALITGASYGIGFAIATAMANCGATIVFNDIKQELVDKGLASYKEAGINAHGYVERRQRDGEEDHRGSGPHQHSGEQRRHHQAHPHVRHDRRAVPPGHRRGPERSLHRVQGCDPRHDRSGRRQDHQHLLHDERAGPRDRFGLQQPRAA